MHAHLALVLALLADIANSKQTDHFLSILKCCGEFEMLSSDDWACVKADWPRNVSFKRKEQFIIPPLDEEWVRRWIPPGLPLQMINQIDLAQISFITKSVHVNVNTSSVWNKNFSLDEESWKKQVVFLPSKYRVYIARPKPGGGMWRASYCVDAALPPLGPFALLLNTKCTVEDCAKKCCWHGDILVKKGGNWVCEKNVEGFWTPFNSPLAKDLGINPEFPFDLSLDCEHPHKVASEDLPDHWPSNGYHQVFFSTWQFCFDYHSSNHTNITLSEGLFYCELSRVARGIYWLLRPLCVVTTLLLAMALKSIACNSSMRRKVHGWCLMSHAFCLFGFNVGQIVYYVTISDILDAILNEKIPVFLQNMCQALALSMYFLLTASWFWLTALCINMAQGFRLQAALPNRRGRKKFLIFSVFAWGLPFALTIACYFLHIPSVDFKSQITASWYNPSLMETRVCYNEYFVFFSSGKKKIPYSYKYGTTLFYYGPVVGLVLCNVFCQVITIRKVQRLRRGNSVLRREEDMRRRAKGNTSSARNMDSGKGRPRGHRDGNGNRIEVDAKTIKFYLKMLLMTGGTELTTEIILWTNTSLSHKYNFAYRDYHFPFRSSGYVTDFFRAALVTWLAAPEGGYLGPILKRLRGAKK